VRELKETDQRVANTAVSMLGFPELKTSIRRPSLLTFIQISQANAGTSISFHTSLRTPLTPYLPS